MYVIFHLSLVEYAFNLDFFNTHCVTYDLIALREVNWLDLKTADRIFILNKQNQPSETNTHVTPRYN